MAASSSQSPFTSFEKPAAPPPAAGFFVLGLVRNIEHRSVVLNLPQSFVGRMTKAAVIGPAAKLDLGDQRRLREDEFFPFRGMTGFFVLSLSSVVLR